MSSTTSNSAPVPSTTSNPLAPSSSVAILVLSPAAAATAATGPPSLLSSGSFAASPKPAWSRRRWYVSMSCTISAWPWRIPISRAVCLNLSRRSKSVPATSSSAAHWLWLYNAASCNGVRPSRPCTFASGLVLHINLTIGAESKRTALCSAVSPCVSGTSHLTPSASSALTRATSAETAAAASCSSLAVHLGAFGLDRWPDGGVADASRTLPPVWNPVDGGCLAAGVSDEYPRGVVNAEPGEGRGAGAAAAADGAGARAADVAGAAARLGCRGSRAAAAGESGGRSAPMGPMAQYRSQ